MNGFVGVASTIAKGNPPEWLVVGLQQFSPWIANDVSKEDRRSFQDRIERMQEAIHTLEMSLPMWLIFGRKCPEHVALMFYALPLLKKDLDGLTKKGVGRRADVQREVCAAVVLEGWKIIHGKAEPHSNDLRQACSDYWQACGGSPDDRDNWRRHIERALTVDHSWISGALYRMHAK